LPPQEAVGRVGTHICSVDSLSGTAGASFNQRVLGPGANPMSADILQQI
jgi:hypothetical protein